MLLTVPLSLYHNTLCAIFIITHCVQCDQTCWFFSQVTCSIHKPDKAVAFIFSDAWKADSSSTIDNYSAWSGSGNETSGYHVCDICHKTFSSLSALKRHYLIHSGEKPYKCDICSSSFNQVSTLKRHIMFHMGIKPFVCIICGHAFTQKSDLKVHMNTHPTQDVGH